MKSTGITRKVDELGRIVIPKEIRSKLKIKHTDELEIYIQDDKIILSKYYIMNNFIDTVKKLTKIVSDITKVDCLIVDTNTIVASNKNIEILNNDVSKNILNILNERKIYDGNKSGIIKISNKDNKTNYVSQIIYPVILESECIGGVILYSNKKNINFKDYIDILKFSSLVIISKLI